MRKDSNEYWYHKVHESLFRMQELADPFEKTDYEAFCCLYAFALYSSVARFFNRNYDHRAPEFIAPDISLDKLEESEYNYKRVLDMIDDPELRSILRNQFKDLIDGMMAN